MSRLNFLLIAVFSVFACSKAKKTTETVEPPSNKKYLAKNVVFSSNQAFAATGDDVDTTKKISASNVLFDAVSISKIKSNNVQSALEEVSLNLSKIIIGAWTIDNKDIESTDPSHVATGRVAFKDDGRFDLESGSFAAIGEGSSGFCSHVEESQSWEKISDSVLYMKHQNGSTQNRAILKVLEFSKDKIVAYGSGGCGAIGVDRISILTRVQ